jgi:Spy/CpxP family protein refolding chaperone
MRLKSVFSAALLFVLGMAALSLAQQRPDGQPGGRGRGGPGGGGGFFFGGGGLGGGGRLAFLQITEVRKELELADEQIAAIEKLQEELRAKYPSPFGGRGGDGDRGRRGRGPDSDRGALTAPAGWYFVQAQQQPGQGRGGRGQPPSPEERARFEQQQLERSREEKARLAEILLPEQLKRLNEIYIQQVGVNALQDEDVAKEIGISEAQKTKLAEIRQQNRDSFGAAMRELFQPGGDPEANRAKMEELRKANDAKLLAVLSSDQQKKFEAMKGKPFQMPEGAGRGGQGGPGGRGRGGRPGINN